MIYNRFLLQWIARAYLDVIVPASAEPNVLLCEQAEYIAVKASEEAFDGFVIDSASIALDVVLVVARCIFNDESIVGVPDLIVLMALEDTFEITEEILMQMLVFAVSSFDCPHRESFVRNILSMDTETQEILMQMIQMTLQQQQANNAIEEEGEECEMVSENVSEGLDTQSPVDDETTQPSTLESASSSHHSLNEDMIITSELVCSSCMNFEQLVEKLKNDKLIERKALETEILELKSSMASETSRLVDTELVVQEKDRLLKEMESKLADHEQLQQKLEEITQQLADKRNMIASLQDQLDVDRSKLDKFDAMEKNLTKMKEKLADLKEIQLQLKTETEAHSQTFQSLIRAEQTVSELRPFQSQVDDYRLELAEQAIALSEANTQLQEARQQVQRLQSMMQSMETSKQAMFSSQVHLAEELQATAEALRSLERCEALGEGMSEFNPVLMQELNKLRAENAELSSKLDRSSLETVEKLQREIADQKVMAKSLTEKWQATKHTLEHTARDLDTTRRQLWELTLQHQQLQEIKREHEAMTQSDLVQQIEVKQELFGTLRATQATLRDIHDELQSVIGKRQRDNENYAEQVAFLTETHAKKLEDFHDIHESQIETLERTHAAALADAEQRLVLVQADLDQEIVKRRKVERLKKLYETESQRQRLQLQHLTTVQEQLGGAGGLYAQGDFEAAAKEIRLLQEKLDEAHRELHLWKTQDASVTSSTASTTVSGSNTNSNIHQSNCNNNKENAAVAVPSTAAVNNYNSASSSQLRKPPLRVLHHQSVTSSTTASVGGVSTSAHSTSMNSHLNPNTGKMNANQLLNYTEQAELHDKQLEQLAREKRELLSKSLEENKEKMELSQRLLALDKENAQLKADLRKRTLEKERLERNLLKSGKLSISEVESDR
jgi:hypothetical protein